MRFLVGSDRDLSRHACALMLSGKTMLMLAPPVAARLPRRQLENDARSATKCVSHMSLPGRSRIQVTLPPKSTRRAPRARRIRNHNRIRTLRRETWSSTSGRLFVDFFRSARLEPRAVAMPVFSAH